MIVQNASKQALVSADGVPTLMASADQPPVYGTSLSPSVFSSGESNVSQGIRPRASNFISISRWGRLNSIEGRFLINPELIIPPTLLPPLAEDETEPTRRNLFLSARDGKIDIDVTVLAGTSEGGARNAPVRMKIESQYGMITAKFRDAAAPSPSPTPRRPYHISISGYSAFGTLHIYFPRSFRGLCSLKTQNGHAKFSSGMQVNLRELSEVKKGMHAFVGDWEGVQGFDSAPNAEKLPVGDVLEAETRDAIVNIHYIDEEVVIADNDGGHGFKFWSSRV